MIGRIAQALAFSMLVAFAVIGVNTLDRWMLAGCSNGLHFAGTAP